MRKRISRVVEQLENAVSLSALGLLLLAVLWGVFTRYVTQSPAVWTSELSGILFTWVVFIGTLTAFRGGKHIRVTLLLDMLPAGAQKMLKILADLIMIAFLVYVTYLSFQMMTLGATRFSPVMRIPFSWVYLACFISFAVMSVTAILRLFGVIEEQAEDALKGDSP